MSELFRIETDRLLLSWKNGRGVDPTPLASAQENLGRLAIRPRRPGLIFRALWRKCPSGPLEGHPDLEIGPHIFEQTDYSLFARSSGGRQVRVLHRDPNILRDVAEHDSGTVLHGTINFGSQVGRSVFTVLVDGEAEFDFEIEVFPTKLDYQNDYAQILAEVQETLTGLAFEYLRATYKLGLTDRAPQPTNLEWVHLLRHVLHDLDQALQYVARKPIRGTIRESVETRSERLRRIDSGVRSAIRCGRGWGATIALDQELRLRERLPERRAMSTLDTAEHRWLASQLVRIRRRIVGLHQTEAVKERSVRRDQVLRELSEVEAHITRLAALEPLRAATGEPPAGFASLQLLTAPGYREAYQCCMVLTLGLRIQDGPLHLTVKDLSTLYEYWCYLALVRILAEETGQQIPLDSLFSVSQKGLQVLLRRGRESRARFAVPGGREVELTYNPTVQGEDVLVPQRPDMLIAVREPDWPRMHLVIDAKYRVDASPEYIERYGAAGPPEDALNLLHRYRDAIIEAAAEPNVREVRPKRTVVQASVVYPNSFEASLNFEKSRLWRALHRIGVGAIPLLPGNTCYLREWVRAALFSGGWALADKVIPHQAEERTRDWRSAAADVVLVGVLRNDNPEDHLDWIIGERAYYAPLNKRQPRQLATKWVSIYRPNSDGVRGAVTHGARVRDIEILKRRDVATPWSSNRAGDDLVVVYRLDEVRPLPRVIRNVNAVGRSSRFSTNRWTSRLALERAHTVLELLLETEPEWRLYESLRARQIEFSIEAGPATLQDSATPRGRAQFVFRDGTRIAYAGEAGYRCKSPEGVEAFIARLEDVIHALLQGAERIGFVPDHAPNGYDPADQTLGWK